MSTKFRKLIGAMLAAVTVASGGAIAGAPAANAGTITGSCPTSNGTTTYNLTFNSTTRTCSGTFTEYMPFEWIDYYYAFDQGYCKPGLTIGELRESVITEPYIPYTGGAKGKYVSGSFWYQDGMACIQNWVYKQVNWQGPYNLGWRGDGTQWTRTGTINSIAPIAGSIKEDTSAAQSAYDAVMNATTSADASTKLTAFIAAVNGLTLQSSRDSFKDEIDAAKKRVTDLQTAEAAAMDEAARKQAAIDKIAAVMSATTYVDATAKLSLAQAAFDTLNATNKAALQGSLTSAINYTASLNAAETKTQAADALAAVLTKTTSADAAQQLTIAEGIMRSMPIADLIDLAPAIKKAEDHIAALQAAEIAAQDEAARKQTAIDAIAAVTAATTYADASAKLSLVQAAFNALNSTNKAELQQSLNDAVNHVATLDIAETTVLAAAALKDVLDKTTSTDAAKQFAVAEGYLGKLPSATVSTLQPQIDAAKKHIADLQAAELEAQNEAQRKQAATARINDVLKATTYADGTARLALAEAAFNALNPTSKAALQSSMNDAVNHVATLELAENTAAAKAALDAALKATTSAEAAKQYTTAQGFLSKMPSGTVATLQTQVTKVEAHIATLQTAELEAQNEAQRKQSTIDAIAAVTKSTTYADAIAKLAIAQTAFGAMSAVNQSALQGDLATASIHVEDIRKQEIMTLASQALANAMKATTSADAANELAKAQDLINQLPLNEATTMKSSVTAAESHVDTLRAAELERATEAVRRREAVDAIAAAAAATTYADAAAKIAVAQSTFDTLSPVNKAALEASLDAAVANVTKLKVAEEVAMAEQALERAKNASSPAEAASRMAEAQAIIDRLPAAEQKKLGPAVQAAKSHIESMVTEQVRGESEEARERYAYNTMQSVLIAVSHRDAASRMELVHPAYAALTEAGKARLAGLLAETERHLASLNPGATTVTVSSVSNRSAALINKIRDLAVEILKTRVELPLIIMSAEMNSLVKAHPAIVTKELMEKVDAANRHVAEVLAKDIQPGGTVGITDVLVGKGESRASDARHLAAVRKAALTRDGIIMVTVAADKDWSPTKRRAYQAKMVKALRAAGVDATDIRVIKPKPVETVTFYAAIPAE